MLRRDTVRVKLDGSRFRSGYLLHRNPKAIVVIFMYAI